VIPALAALALAAPAQAADWTRVTAKDQHEHYYDRGKLAIESDQITYWRRVVFRPPQPTRNGVAGTAMYRERIDCTLHTHRTLGYLLYGVDGGVLENVYTPDAPSDPIIPETVGDRFGDTMCALVARERSRNVARRAAEKAASEKSAVDRSPAETAPRPGAALPDVQAGAAAPEQMNQQQLLTEIARLEERLAQLRAQLATMSAPAPAVREAPPLSLPEPVVLQDDARAPALPEGTPTP